MTTTVTAITTVWIIDGANSPTLAAIGYVAIVLLFVVLVQNEFTRAYHGTEAKPWVSIQDSLTWPLLFMFAIFILIRYLTILNVL